MPGLVDGHTHISFGESRSEEENALYTPVEMQNERGKSGLVGLLDAAAGRSSRSITQSPHLIVDCQNILILAVNHLLNVARQLFIQRFTIIFYGGVLALFRFRQNGVIIAAGYHGLQTDPAPVNCARC